jgi:nitrogenase molybdenum-iron protein alpha/beta subunit
MTGAAACLAGFKGVSVVIHGSSGCYYYPTTLLHAPLHGTFILDNEVIFGSEDRLSEVIGGLAGKGNRIAVITTCVPAVLGEDIKSILETHDVILVDSPGFAGDVETGYKTALSVLDPKVDPDAAGVNIDGACLFDPFSRGNVQEIRRLLGMASIPVGTVFADDAIDAVWHASPLTLRTNTDFASGVGTSLGGTLGFDELRRSFKNLESRFSGADAGPVLAEIEEQEERIVKACDKFLRRYDPPSVLVFAGASYADFAARTLSRYLDADILGIGTRNEPMESRYPIRQVNGLNEVKSMIETHIPDLVIGSSFERSISRDPAFVGIIPPLRGNVRLAPHPLAGINGTLSFMEQALNACMDRRAGQP